MKMSWKCGLANKNVNLTRSSSDGVTKERKRQKTGATFCLSCLGGNRITKRGKENHPERAPQSIRLGYRAVAGWQAADCQNWDRLRLNTSRALEGKQPTVQQNKTWLVSIMNFYHLLLYTWIGTEITSNWVRCKLLTAVRDVLNPDTFNGENSYIS